MSTSIVWAPLRADTPLARSLGVREAFHVPFLAMGEEVDRITRGGVTFGPKHLLFGILVGYDDDPPTLDVDAIRQRLRPLLDGLARGFGYETTEQCVLDVGANLRDGGHEWEGRTALATGRALFPTDSKIACDYAMMTWGLLADAAQSDLAHYLAEVRSAARAIDYDDITAAARETVAYMHFAAVRCLGDHDALGRVLEEEVYAHVKSPDLKVKVKRALEDPSAAPDYLYVIL